MLLAKRLTNQPFAGVIRRLIFTTRVRNVDSTTGSDGGSGGSMDYESIEYKVEGRVAHIVLNRPHRFNAIDAYMPFELERAVEDANLNDVVKVTYCRSPQASILGGWALGGSRLPRF